VAHIVFLAGEGKGGGPCDHAQAGNPDQRVDDVIGQTVAEVLVFLPTGKVEKAQHGYRHAVVGNLARTGPYPRVNFSGC
jgi:hypothetical protein